MLHSQEGALLGTLRRHHPGRAKRTRAPSLSRGGQPQISLRMVVWPGVRICPLGHSILKRTNFFMGCLHGRHEKIVRNRERISHEEQTGAEAVRQQRPWARTG